MNLKQNKWCPFETEGLVAFVLMAMILLIAMIWYRGCEEQVKPAEEKKAAPIVLKLVLPADVPLSGDTEGTQELRWLLTDAILDAIPLQPSRFAKPIETKAVVRAYCPCELCCGEWADGYTASGQPVTYNGGKFLAAPERYPFGTMILVPGYHDKPVPVLDRGGAVTGRKFEVFFNSHKEALQWSAKELIITITPWGTSKRLRR